MTIPSSTNRWWWTSGEPLMWELEECIGCSTPFSLTQLHLLVCTVDIGAHCCIGTDYDGCFFFPQRTQKPSWSYRDFIYLNVSEPRNKVHTKERKKQWGKSTYSTGVIALLSFQSFCGLEGCQAANIGRSEAIPTTATEKFHLLS